MTLKLTTRTCPRVPMAGMTSIRLTRELLADGYTHSELAAQLRAGSLTRVRRGAYDHEPEDEIGLRHLQLVEATLRLTAPSAVVSHVSAAVVHGLPVISGSVGRVQVTRADVSGGRNRGAVHLYAAPLSPEEVVMVGGLRVTSLARTVVDLGRTEPFERAVVTGDAVLRRRLPLADLTACLNASIGRPGIGGARRVVEFLDARSESPGESLSRAALHLQHLPPPTPQFEVRRPDGLLVGRSDFGWEEHRTLGEFDGRVKYGRTLKPDGDLEDVLWQEKLREDALRDLGWEVVRWTWWDLHQPAEWLARLERAFARARRVG
jgi:hypothetical protein